MRYRLCVTTMLNDFVYKVIFYLFGIFIYQTIIMIRIMFITKFNLNSTRLR